MSLPFEYLIFLQPLFFPFLCPRISLLCSGLYFFSRGLLLKKEMWAINLTTGQCLLPGELNADASLGIFFKLCRAVAPLYTVAMNRHIRKAGTTSVLPSVSPGISSPVRCVSESRSAEKRCYEHTEEQNRDGTQCSRLLPRPLTQVRAPAAFLSAPAASV